MVKQLISLILFLLIEFFNLPFQLSRTSIDALKNHFRDEVTKDEWLFIKDVLKPFFGIL